VGFCAFDMIESACPRVGREVHAVHRDAVMLTDRTVGTQIAVLQQQQQQQQQVRKQIVGALFVAG